MPSPTSSPAMRAHLDSQIGEMADFTRKNFDTARRLCDLNITFARDLFEDYFSASRQLLASGDPAQLSHALTSQVQPFTARLRSYQQQLSGLLGAAQIDATRAAEHLAPEATGALHAFTESVTHARFGGDGGA